MDTRMRLGRMIIFFYALCILALMVVDVTIIYEDETLLLFCNTLFIGVIPLIIAMIAGYAYVKNSGVNALFMSCGMLAVGLGSTVTGILQLRPDSANIAVTMYNSCAFFGAVCQFAASQKVYLSHPEKGKNRELKLLLAFSLICILVIGLLEAVLNGQTPLFIYREGSTRLRDAVLWLAIAFYYFAYLQMNWQYKIYKSEYLYWYALSLLLIALGLAAVCVAGRPGTVLGWVGRSAQYIGAVCALISIVYVAQAARKHGSSLPAIMADFFAGNKDNYICLAEHAAVAVITVDKTGRIFFSNSAAAKMLGYEKKDLFRTSFFRLLPEPYKDDIRQDFEDYTVMGKSRLAAPVEMEITGKDGKHVPVEIAAAYYVLPAGYACTYILYDMSERKQAAKALRQKEALVQAIIDGTEDPVFLKNASGAFLMGNRALSLAMGMPLEMIIGKTDAQIYTDQEKARQLMENDKSILASGAAQSLEEIVPTPEGLKTFLSIKTPWRSDGGDVLGIIGIAHDITQRKAMETELIRKTGELEEKNRLITDFFINISHEFKTPLSIIVLLTDLMDQAAGPEDCISYDSARFVKMMRVNAYRLRRLVDNLLDITKLDAGFMEPQWEHADVVALVKSIVSSTEAYARQKGLALSFSCGMDQLQMSTDSLMLERILLNLLSNAMKHTSPGGAIHVDCHVHDDMLTITVTDNGEGIPEEKKSVIFDRFRQVNTSLARTSEGCGIGLSICKALTELMGGRIAFQSGIGTGSAFSVMLPVMHLTDAGYAVDLSGMNLISRVQMELSDIDFG